MYDKKQSNEENFWISYADLMAGLLFVFILVIGAIIIKYLYTQSDLKAIKTNLQEQKDALNLSEEELLNKKKKLTSVNSQLKKIQEEKVRLSFDLAKSQNMFNETKELLEKEKDLAKKLGIQLDEKNKNVILTDLGIDKIEKLAIQKRILKNNFSNFIVCNYSFIDI